MTDRVGTVRRRLPTCAAPTPGAWAGFAPRTLGEVTLKPLSPQPITSGE